ncbi:MAG TPA: hypothetical protein VGU63_03780 [Candidatus Acidoferrales bacterium]|nr:hypothetical protein [Candidatus Acidoferrales bacterium]
MRSLLLITTLGLLATVPQIQQPDVSKFPAQDAHQDFMVAADNYSDAARSKEKFGKDADPYKVGLLAVDIYFRNDTKYPVHVGLDTIRLNVNDPNGQKFHLEPLSLARAANAIAHPKGPSAPVARRLPIPLPQGDSKQQGVMDKLRPFTLQSDVVPPGGTIHGCVFFDMNHRFDLVRYATLYVPDVKSVASDAGMIYFEVGLAPKRAE